MDRKRVIGVEFIGGIAERTHGNGWKFRGDQWRLCPNALRGTYSLVQNGFFILIHTVLINPDVDIDAQRNSIQSFLKTNGVHYDDIFCEMGRPLTHRDVRSPEEMLECQLSIV